jgi:PIN domain nuclease of toxin-antitoxin system
VTILLLDTEALIWWDGNDPRLGGKARAAIQDADIVYVSAASAWEIVIKTALGKLRTTRRTAVAVAEGGFRELPITFEHAEAVRNLPRHHADPFDRMMIARRQSRGVCHRHEQRPVRALRRQADRRAPITRRPIQPPRPLLDRQPRGLPSIDVGGVPEDRPTGAIPTGHPGSATPSTSGRSATSRLRRARVPPAARGRRRLASGTASGDVPVGNRAHRAPARSVPRPATPDLVRARARCRRFAVAGQPPGPPAVAFTSLFGASSQLP